MQRPEKSNVKELNDLLLRTATVPQPGSPVDHSPIAESGGDPETGSNASEQVADEVPVPHREPTVSAQNSTKSAFTQDELVGRAIGMIRTALGNGSDAAPPA